MENRMEAKDTDNEVSQKNDGLNLNSISKCSDQSSPVFKCDTNSSSLNLPNVEISTLGSKADLGKKNNEKEDMTPGLKDQSRCPSDNDDDDDDDDDDGEGGGGYKSDEHMSGKENSGKDAKNHKEQNPDSAKDGKESYGGGFKEKKDQFVGKEGKMGPDLHVEPEQWQQKEYSKKGNDASVVGPKSQKERFGKSSEGLDLRK